MIPEILVKYTLMHKDVPVIDLTLNDESGSISEIGDIINMNHLPIGTVRYGELVPSLLDNWWKSRSIPASRRHIKSFLCDLFLPDTQYLLTKSMGLSLSDHYWIKPVGESIGWSEVNFFENEFSEDIGRLLFGHGSNLEVDFLSPDNTTDGVLKKRWKLINGRRCLLKVGPDRWSQESYNEEIASILADVLAIPNVKYSVEEEGEYTVSICDNFLDTDTELITAHQVLGAYTYAGPKDTYHKYVDACAILGIEIVPFLDRMIVLDYIMENYDRHLGNFGLIRNADTLEILGPAPIYDTGSSLRCYTKMSSFWKAKPNSKPFCEDFDDTLKYVKSFDFVNFHSLYAALDMIESRLHDSHLEGSGLVDDIVRLLDERITKLRDYVNDRK